MIRQSVSLNKTIYCFALWIFFSVSIQCKIVPIILTSSLCTSSFFHYQLNSTKLKWLPEKKRRQISFSEIREIKWEILLYRIFSYFLPAVKSPNSIFFCLGCVVTKTRSIQIIILWFFSNFTRWKMREIWII